MFQGRLGQACGDSAFPILRMDAVGASTQQQHVGETERCERRAVASPCGRDSVISVSDGYRAIQ